MVLGRVLIFYTFMMPMAQALEVPLKICTPSSEHITLSRAAIAKELGWVIDNNRCGGYYLEPPIQNPAHPLKPDIVEITSNEGGLLYSLHGTSVSQGKMTITQNGQQIIAKKGYLYRDPTTENLSAIDVVGEVTLRQPNQLVIAKCGHVDLKNKKKSLENIIYRTTVYSKLSKKPPTPTIQQLITEQKIYHLSAWGKADEFKQDEPDIYHFKNASFSTCPPLTRVWQVTGRDITLNKETGRGSAFNAKFLLKDTPILYVPYLNFPIDARRQTGFLWPMAGSSSASGAYLKIPFYWNIAPNYDTTITPVILAERGLDLTDLFRYLTHTSNGKIQGAILPGDRKFASFKEESQEKYKYSINPMVRSELHRLEDSSTTRTSFSWQDKTHFNEHWAADVDYNFVSDDYYLKDLGNNLVSATQNQLLQQAEMTYRGQYWDFLGRVQGYETLHPINENPFQNQYIRLPQLILDYDYLNKFTGLDFFAANEATHFDIHKNPGSYLIQPIGDRINVQPGISYPLYRSYFYIIPRVQFAFTAYDLSTKPFDMPSHSTRSLPIVDVHSGLYFDRSFHIRDYFLKQTLEPQIYYTYVPYKNQNDLPIFDTSLNTLTYDQLFMYNRFSGIDRIGDANQISVGVTTRFIDEDTGLEKIKAGIGQIIYFEHRRVTLCEKSVFCTDLPDSPENTRATSPISAIFSYNLTPHWTAIGNTIWDLQLHHLNNQTVAIRYMPDPQRIINLGYSFVRNGDTLFIDRHNTNHSNLSQTDFSIAWPIARDWATVGRWTQNWNHNHFQNLLYGLQYDSCCWAIRFVTGRTFTNISPNNTFHYNKEFYIQVALKGLGNFGTGDPTQFLTSSIGGFQSNFGQDF